MLTLQPVDRGQRGLVLRRQRCDDRRLAADRDHHHLIRWFQRLDERARGALRRVEPRAAASPHAEAAVQPDGDGKRELAGGKCGDRLGRSILADANIGSRQVLHRCAALIRHGHVHFDEVHAGRKLRISAAGKRQPDY